MYGTDAEKEAHGTGRTPQRCMGKGPQDRDLGAAHGVLERGAVLEVVAGSASAAFRRDRQRGGAIFKPADCYRLVRCQGLGSRQWKEPRTGQAISLENVSRTALEFNHQRLQR